MSRESSELRDMENDKAWKEMELRENKSPLEEEYVEWRWSKDYSRRADESYLSYFENL
jgi:hypothetical protein